MSPSGTDPVPASGLSSAGSSDINVLPSVSVHFQLYRPAPKSKCGDQLPSGLKAYSPSKPTVKPFCLGPSSMLVNELPAPSSEALSLKSASLVCIQFPSTPRENLGDNPYFTSAPSKYPGVHASEWSVITSLYNPPFNPIAHLPSVSAACSGLAEEAAHSRAATAIGICLRFILGNLLINGSTTSPRRVS